MYPNEELLEVLAAAYGPCRHMLTHGGGCLQSRWSPAAGQVPRGFLRATGPKADLAPVTTASLHPATGRGRRLRPLPAAAAVVTDLAPRTARPTNTTTARIVVSLARVTGPPGAATWPLASWFAPARLSGLHSCNVDLEPTKLA